MTTCNGSAPDTTARRCKCGRLLQKKGHSRGMCHRCWQAYRYRMLAYGKWTPMYIDIGPTLAHLNELRAKGLGVVRIAQLTGLHRQTVQKIGFAGRKLVSRRVAEAILALPIPEESPSPFSEMIAPGAMIPSVGTMRRLQALAVMGYDLTYLAERLGMKFQQVSYLRLGRSKKVQIRTARKVAELFEELQMTPGPSAETKRIAERNRWYPPLAWDEETIDDPDAKPSELRKERKRRDVAQEVAEYRANGLYDDQIAERFGLSIDAFQTLIRRHGIPRGRRYRDIEERDEVLRRNDLSRRALGLTKGAA